MPEPEYVCEVVRAYDVVAPAYAALLRDELEANPVDRAVLALFAELVRTGGGGPVADLGCGTGRVLGHLGRLGLPVVGIDRSPGMLRQSTRDHPRLPVALATMAALPLRSGSLAGILAWYSIIHTPPQDLPPLFREFARTLRPGGRLLLAFQAGHERVRLEHAYGHAVSYDAYRLGPERVVELATGAGFAVGTRVLREPVPPEKTPQAYQLFHRVTGAAGRP